MAGAEYGKQTGVVINQPGKGGPAPMQPPVMQMPNVMVPAGLPPGLAYLAGLDEVRIHQILEMLEGKGLDDLYKACMRALLALKCRGHICK
jgi:hypothetical protein